MRQLISRLIMKSFINEIICKPFVNTINSNTRVLNIIDILRIHINYVFNYIREDNHSIDTFTQIVSHLFKVKVNNI
jgi:hypothetical protein